MTIFGKTGSGKSNFMAYLIHYMLNVGAHVTLVDKGNSFKKLFLILKDRFRCKRYEWSDEDKLSFNPFLMDMDENGNYLFERDEKSVYLLQILNELIAGGFTKLDMTVISNLLAGYILPLFYKDFNERGGDGRSLNFNAFFEYLEILYDRLKSSSKLSQDDAIIYREFPFEKVFIAFKQFYKGGGYDFLLNSKENYNISKDVFVLFELDKIQQDPFLFRLVTICISQIQDSKLSHKQLVGVLKYFVIDEGTFMLNDRMGEVIAGYYQTVRKHGGGMIFSDQTVDKLVKTGFANRIISNSDTNILLEQTLTKDTKTYLYDFFNITDLSMRKVESINNSGPWREGVICMGDMIESFRLRLCDEYMLALNTDNDNPLNKRLLDLYRKFNDMGIKNSMNVAVRQVSEEIK